MKVLLVTSKKVKKQLRQRVGEKHKVLNLPVDVAAFISPSMVLKELGEKEIEGIDVILVPGNAAGDFSIVKEKTGIECYKGPKNLHDIPLVLELLEKGMGLSSKKPADGLVEERKKQKAQEEIQRGYEPEKPRMQIKDVKTGRIMHVVAEIPDSPFLSEKELVEKARYCIKEGASVIDLGMVAGEDNSRRIGEMIQAVRKEFPRVPLCVDSVRKEEIQAAIKSNADMIMSLDAGNLETAKKEINAVVIPRDEEGRIPDRIGERIRLLEELIQELKKKEVNVIADPILDVPGFGLSKAICSYREFRNRNPNVPVLIGAGNVSEMMDADSIGINALVSVIASEVDADFLFTTEASSKTRGSISELKEAAQMMYLARAKKQPPKDLGIDLLRLKDKRFENVKPELGEIKEIRAARGRSIELEENYFHIWVDYQSKKIKALFIRNQEAELLITGEKAREIYLEIIDRDLVKKLSHAAYLGRELSKAEAALKINKKYIQDEPLFI